MDVITLVVRSALVVTGLVIVVALVARFRQRAHAAQREEEALQARLAPTGPHICPACGFELSFSPWPGAGASHELCPCCGIHFGLDDFAAGVPSRRGELYARWRGEWVRAGMPWRGRARPPPDWQPDAQLYFNLDLRGPR